jgi:hypothetical protein
MWIWGRMSSSRSKLHFTARFAQGAEDAELIFSFGLPLGKPKTTSPAGQYKI